MLLRFGVQNHLSFNDRAELSMIASSLKDTEAGLIDCIALTDEKILPVAVIYGANASGKSNFVSALSHMTAAVLHSHSKGDPEGGLNHYPFALDQSKFEEPSSFDIDFVIDNVRYGYGFDATKKAFTGEWLYMFKGNHRTKIFERNEEKFSFGRKLKGRNKVISELTRPNSLFLSAAAQNGHDQLGKIAGFFQSLRSDRRIEIPGVVVASQLTQGDVDNRVIRFLNKVGTGVVDYRKQSVEVSPKIVEFQKIMVKALQKMTGQEIESPKLDSDSFVIELAHHDCDGDKVFFDLNRESAGTRRLLLLLGRVFRALDRGAVLVIDELDASLHTQACEAILALFESSEINVNGAQLIATTHDTTLLQSKSLRRDQVWFVEKDESGGSRLYPLSDIRTRKGDNIEKGYLQGRFGAMPFDGSIGDFLRESA